MKRHHRKGKNVTNICQIIYNLNICPQCIKESYKSVIKKQYNTINMGKIE